MTGREQLIVMFKERAARTSTPQGAKDQWAEAAADVLIAQIVAEAKAREKLQ